MQQLNNTAIDDIVRSTVALDEFGTCLLCLRPVERKGKNVRVVENLGMYCEILKRSNTCSASSVFQKQMLYMQREDEAVICYICQPASKKAERQYEQGGSIDNPSLFIEATLQHCQGESKERINRQCLLKGLMCLGTTVTDGTSTLYNELRTKENAVLEYSICLLHELLNTQGMSLREFARSCDMCVFGIVVLCRWEIMGFPHTMLTKEDNKVFRRVYGGVMFDVFDRMHAQMDMHRVRDGQSQGVFAGICAVCSREQAFATPCRPGSAYDLVTADRGALREILAEHKLAHELQRGHVFLCRDTGKFGVVSYAHYRSVCWRFPRQFREEHAERYYLFLLRENSGKAGATDRMRT